MKLDARIIVAIFNGELPTWPSSDAELHSSIRNRGLMDKLKDVCSYCWKDKEERPDMSKIMNMLDNIQG